MRSGPPCVVVLADLGAVESLGERHVVEEPVVDGRDVDVLGGRARAQPRQPDQDLPLAGTVRFFGLEHRRRVVGDAVDREVEDQVVVVRLFQRRQPGQDHVGVPGRLVEPEVDGDHRVQLRQHLVERVTGRSRQHRVARDGDERLDLALPRRRDLLGQARHRHLTEHLLGAAHPRAEAAELRSAVFEAGDRLHGHRPRGGAREHRAACVVEVPGENVDDVDEPAGQAAEFLVARTDPAVHHGALGAHEFAGQRSDALRVDAGDAGDPLRGPVRGHLPQTVEPVDVGGQLAEGDQILVEQRVGDGQQQRRVGARRDRQPLVGAGRGQGADRVDHNHLAALTNSVDDAHHVRCGEQRALRRGRVGAHHHQQVGALDVGHRERPPAAVHQVRRQVLRPLIDGAGRVGQRDARHAQQHSGVAAEREGMRERVSGVAGHRADAVLLDHRRQQFGAAPERRIPADLLPLPVDLDHRPADAVGVLVHGAEAGALRADVAATPGVVAVAADAGHAAVVDLNLQAAHGFAQRAGVEVAAVLADTRQQVRLSGGHIRLR